MPTSVRVSLILVALGLAAAAIWIYRDYRKWRELGPGGLPPNLIGWLKTTRMRLQKGDPLDTDSYTAQIGAAGDCSFLPELPKREGRRPAIAVHPVPHRQLDQFVGDDMREKIKDLFDTTVVGGSGLLQYKQSYLEKRHQAAFLCRLEGAHSHAADSHGEIAHIHPSDNSMHMIFSASDARTVILDGWGERHPLAGRPLPGTKLVLPDTYLLIYPPRNDFELKVTARLLDAAVRHMAALPRSDVKPVRDERQEAKHA